MCTTMRRMRRGTLEGTTMKLFKRRVTQGIKRLTRELSQAKTPDEVEGMMTRLLKLRTIRKAIKI